MKIKILLSLLSSAPYLELPRGVAGWLVWLLLLSLTGLLLWKTRDHNRVHEGGRRWIFLALLVATPLTALFLGAQLPAGALPPLDMPMDPAGPAVMVFSALPWILAAGLLGPLPAAVIALLSGLLQALFDTHNLFTPLEIALLALLFTACVNQRYRTLAFRLLRQPLAAAILAALLFPFIALVDIPFVSRGLLASRLDFALDHISGLAVAMGIELVVAGIFAEVVVIAIPALWDGRGNLESSPAERSLQARFLYTMAPLALVLIVALMASSWIVAGRTAQDLLRQRMAGAAGSAAESVPFFLEIGQSLVAELAEDPRLLDPGSAELEEILAEGLHTVPFFRQLFVLDQDGNLVAGYPNRKYASAQAPVEEQMGVQLALNGIPYQSFTVPPLNNDSTAQVSFMAALPNGKGGVRGVLIGRSDLASNPFIQPVINSLNNLAEIDGQGFLIDENGDILYHPNPDLVMTLYSGRRASGPLFYDEASPSGARQLVYYQPAVGRPWGVVLTVPAYRAQEMAFRIAAPLLAMIIFLSLVSLLILRLGLRVVTASLKNLAVEAERISKGQLDHQLSVDGEDEVGQLRRAFEGMRASLSDRLDELNRLLLVSRGVASSLQIEAATQPVLESALAMGGSAASAARIVLAPDIASEMDNDSEREPLPTRFGLGPCTDQYSHLDEQVLALARKQERLVLTNLTRPRIFDFQTDKPFSENLAKPESLLAVALHHENRFYGALWVAYEQPRQFSEEEVRFLVTLGSHAALAAANTHLFHSAEIGRQRLAAILASTPEPVLVTDERDRLLLANPAAWQVLRLGMETDAGRPIEKVISQRALVDLLRADNEEKGSAEVELPGGRTLLATASSVLAEGQRVGRVCVLRDVTHFKELNSLKSDFVSTVSHDLRSPLTLMRGYATMLEMVGELNEQQLGYVRKIVGGVESMTRLVNNLLDLSRIETGVGLQLEMVSIKDIVDRVIGALQLQATQKRINISLDIPRHTIPLVEADGALLQQALYNLVDNAIKYTRAEGKVAVRVAPRQDRMVFEVQDSGIGISPMDQPRLFERFYRGAQPGSKDQRGTGLGLAIVKSIAERHGGQVWAESQLGKGSTFNLAIPLQQKNGNGNA